MLDKAWSSIYSFLFTPKAFFLLFSSLAWGKETSLDMGEPPDDIMRFCGLSFPLYEEWHLYDKVWLS